ncbi:MAG: hypothetical protein KIS91_05760 [Anaerolineae bacterium]|nr:hypothetical protein [Anaerolineae bacterium]
MPTVADLYADVVTLGPEATDRYYACLRAKGIHPTPDETGDLYAPNPVIVDGQAVRWLLHDVNLFAEHRRAATRDGADLLALLPAEVREGFASPDVADALWAHLQVEPPLAQLDAFLVETPDGLTPRYIEWQTFGAYATLARLALACAQDAWPPLQRASATATPGWTLADLDAKLRALYMRGIEDDPRQGVVLDYRPLDQVTRREFFAIQALTGGEGGMGILDPREVVYRDGRPHYHRDGGWLPIRRAYSRLVHGDMARRLLHEATRDEAAAMRRFFGDAGVTWISHPIHFYYGTKAHFADFYAAGLSPRLPGTWAVTDELLRDLRAEGRDALGGLVYKPTTGHGGQAVEADPLLAALKVGGLLQERIAPAACHTTLYGSRAPEVRLMAIPDGRRLAGAALFTRVMAADAFKSNAGAIVAQGVAGTGEGYAFTVW